MLLGTNGGHALLHTPYFCLCAQTEGATTSSFGESKVDALTTKVGEGGTAALSRVDCYRLEQKG